MQLTNSQIDCYRANGFLAIDQEVFTTTELDAVRTRIDTLYDRRLELPARRTKHVAESNSQLCEVLGASVLDPKLADLAVVRRCEQMAQTFLGRRRVWLHFDHMFYKNPGDHSVVPWHQDGAYSVTKMTYRAVHFWIPFQDVDQSNGCMQYVAGSHLDGLRDHSPRDSGVGPRFRSVDIAGSKGISCPIRVGGVVLHDPMTLHYSGPNRSPTTRRAWVLQFGTGPWPATRALARPIMTASARLQMATRRAHL